MKKELKEAINIEEEFFDIDKEKHIATMKLEFDRPSDIFDSNAITKIPVLSDDFIDWMKVAFDYAPNGYKINLDIAFSDMEGYKEESLLDIFKKNLLLEGKKGLRKQNTKNKIAVGLLILGLMFLIGLILIQTLWQQENVAKTIVTYIADILATVTFWEALTILVVESKERRDYLKDLSKKFSSIKFHKKGE